MKIVEDTIRKLIAQINIFHQHALVAPRKLLTQSPDIIVWGHTATVENPTHKSLSQMEGFMEKLCQLVSKCVLSPMFTCIHIVTFVPMSYVLLQKGISLVFH